MQKKFKAYAKPTRDSKFAIRKPKQLWLPTLKPKAVKTLEWGEL